MLKTITKKIVNENGEEIEITETVEVADDAPGAGGEDSDKELSPSEKIAKGLEQQDKVTKNPEPKGSEDDKGNSTDNAEILAQLKKEKDELLKEVMKKKEKLKEYEGIDPAKAKALLQEKADAEAEAKRIEKEALEKTNNWEALRKQMVDEHNIKLSELQTQIDSYKNQLDSVKKEKETLFVNSKFEESNYIKNNLVLTPKKVQILYGEYFDLENGDIIAYNSPRGSEKRARMVDAEGSNLSFDKAIERIVNLDPDKNTLLKSTVHTGSNGKPSVNNRDGIPVKLSPVEKIAKGLSDLKK